VRVQVQDFGSTELVLVHSNGMMGPMQLAVDTLGNDHPITAALRAVRSGLHRERRAGTHRRQAGGEKPISMGHVMEPTGHARASVRNCCPSLFLSYSV
jgi:hypothetical protein